MPETIKLDGDRNGVAWIDVDVADPESRIWLSSQANLSEECVSLLLQTPKLSRRDETEEGLLITLSGLDPGPSTGLEGTGSLRLLIQQSRLVTVRSGQVMAIEEIRDQLRAGAGPTTPVHFLASLVVCGRKRLEPLVASISEETDDLEDRVLTSNDEPPLNALDALRRRVFLTHRHLVAAQGVLRLTVADPTVPMSKDEREALNGTSELIDRYLTSLVDSRERALLLHDKIDGQISQNMAQATYNLTIIATVFLPLTFVTGLLGMNVSGIPESHDPNGFWIVNGVLIALALCAWGLLRWKKRLILS
jgi:zinc transporter